MVDKLDQEGDYCCWSGWHFWFMIDYVDQLEIKLIPRMSSLVVNSGTSPVQEMRRAPPMSRLLLNLRKNLHTCVLLILQYLYFLVKDFVKWILQTYFKISLISYFVVFISSCEGFCCIFYCVHISLWRIMWIASSNQCLPPSQSSLPSPNRRWKSSRILLSLSSPLGQGWPTAGKA